ncbi:hypothetical protein FOA52_006814 [Chlamydomonas sp. UWO 241]|nr:hypothetical protein FOA52_006814 [Chlamydomonas sp. UWO 241]
MRPHLRLRLGGVGEEAGGGDLVLGAAPMRPMQTGTAPMRLEEKTREVEALRRALQEREAVLLKKKQEADAKEAARLAAEAAQRELQRKRQHLNKGFSSVAPPAAAAPAPAPPPAGPSSSGGGGGDGADAPEAVAAARGADTAEVARVLGAPNDYEVLRLHVGAPLSTVRKAYRALAVSLHPDKCSTEGAGDAFQRVQAAYTALVKNLGG